MIVKSPGPGNPSDHDAGMAELTQGTHLSEEEDACDTDLLRWALQMTSELAGLYSPPDHKASRAGLAPGEHLIEEEDARLGQDGARNGDALLLAAAEADAALAHFGAVALREGADELMRICQHGRPLHLQPHQHRPSQPPILRCVITGLVRLLHDMHSAEAAHPWRTW